MKNKRIETGLEIAVIGMAGRFPRSKNLREFFDNLTEGKELISFFSDEELMLEGVNSDRLNHEHYIKAKGIIEDTDFFDSQFFGYAPRDVEIMDPQIRLFHECVWEALEDAGYIADECNDTIGLCAAASENMAWQQHIYENYGEMDAGKPYVNKDFLAMLLAYKCNMNGPVYMVNTACSSSLVTIHEACRNILTGESKMMIAGGVSLSSPQKQGYLYQEDMILSKDGHLRPFEVDSSGAVGGSGVGAVVLKALKSAVQDGDHIYAVINGSAINNDGNRKAGFTAPSIEGQRKVITRALRMARVSADDVVYVETHGTGTKLGDPTEISALTKAFHTDKKGYCAIGAVKANIGHLDAASGIAGFIKTVMVLNKKVIPPMINFVAPNPNISFLDTPFYTPQDKINISSNENIDFAGISSFGIGGTNAHVILQEYIEDKKSIYDNRKKFVFLSARNKERLNQYCSDLADYLTQNPETNCYDMEYTLQVGRKQFDYRKVICFDTIDDLIPQLRDKESNCVKSKKSIKSKLMLYAPATEYREHKEHLLKYSLFAEIMKNCDNIIEQKNIKISKKIESFKFEYTYFKFLKEVHSIHYDEIYSTKDNAILCCCLAGIISFEDGIECVQLIQSKKQEFGILSTYINFSFESSKIFIEGTEIRNQDILISAIFNKHKSEQVDNTFVLYIEDDHNVTKRVDLLLNRSDESEWNTIFATLWCLGRDIDWSKVHKNGTYRRISLPTYPFERIEYKKKIKSDKSTHNLDFEQMCVDILKLEKRLFEQEKISSVRKNIGFYNIANKICTAYIYQYFENCGIEFTEGKQYTVQQIIEKLNIIDKYKKMVYSFIDVLEEDEILVKDKKSNMIIVSRSQDWDIEGIKSYTKRKYDEYTGLFNLIGYCCTKYKDILSGKSDALHIMYPNGKSISTNPRYQVNSEHSYCNIYINLLKNVIMSYIQKYKNIRSIKILEIGSGNGKLTKHLLKQLAKNNVEYYFTDIVPYFIEEGKKEYSDSEYDFVKFKKFDITQNPMKQGFNENYFDIVIGLNVVHATTNICESLKNIKKVLMPDGILGLIESIHNERWYNMIDGLDEGWWYFEDDNIRSERLIELDVWRKCYREVGLHSIYTFPVDAKKEQITDTGMILGKKEMETFQMYDSVPAHEKDNREYERNGVSSKYVEPISSVMIDITKVISEFLGIKQLGIHDNFYEIGIDSIIAIQISSKLHKQGYIIRYEDIMSNPTVEELSEKVSISNVDRINENLEQGDRIIFTNEKDKEILEKMMNEDENVSMIYPLSPMQKMILGQNTIYRSKGLDVFALFLDIEGKIHPEQFEKAWNLILQKHSILRTAFIWRKLREPVQVVYYQLNMNIKYDDLTMVNENEQEIRINQYLDEEKKIGFKGTQPPLTRGYLVKVSNTKYTFIWTFQHSLIDGWSMTIIINDMINIYNKLRNDIPVEIDKKPYINYISWLMKQDEKTSQHFWKKLFENYVVSSNKNESEPIVKFNMDEVMLSIGYKEKIQKFVAKHNITPCILFQTAWALTIKKISKEEDLILGFETSGRGTEVEDMVSMAGIFISVIPYRATINKNISCIEWMKQLKDNNLEMRKHEYVTLQDISKWTNISISTLQDVVYNKTFVYQNFPIEIKESTNDFRIIVERKEADLSIQLRLYVIPGEDFEALIYFNSEKYTKEYASKMINIFKGYVFNLIDSAESSILSLK